MLLWQDRAEEVRNRSTHCDQVRLKWWLANIGRFPVSTGYLLLSHNPGAWRLICLGGTTPLLGQLPIAAADGLPQGALGHLGLADVPSPEVVQRLLDVLTEDVWKRIPPDQPIVPVIDDEMVPTEVTIRLWQEQKP